MVTGFNLEVIAQPQLVIRPPQSTVEYISVSVFAVVKVGHI